MTILWTHFLFLSFRAGYSYWHKHFKLFPPCPPLPSLLPSPSCGEFCFRSCFKSHRQPKPLPSCGGPESSMAVPGQAKHSGRKEKCESHSQIILTGASWSPQLRCTDSYVRVHIHIEGIHLVLHPVERWLSLPCDIGARLAICQELKGCASI